MRATGRDILSPGLLPKCLEQPRLGQTETRYATFHSCSPRKWQGSRLLSHHPLLLHPRMIGRKLDWKQRCWDSWRVNLGDCGLTHSAMISAPTSCIFAFTTWQPYFRVTKRKAFKP